MQFLKWWKPFLKWFVDAAVFETAAQGCWSGLGTAGWNGNQLAQEKKTLIEKGITQLEIMS